MKNAEVEVCPTCHSELRRYWHRLTPGLVEALVKFSRAIQAKGRNSVHTRSDTRGRPYELTHEELGNFTKLRHHGLVAKDKRAGMGYWLLTARGASFLRGDLAIPSKVQTLNNVVQHHGGELVFLKDVFKSDAPHFEGVQDIEYEVVRRETAQTQIPL